MAERMTADESDVFRRRVFALRARGVAWAKIASGLDKSVSTCKYHYNKHNAATAGADDPNVNQDAIAHEMLATFRELRQEAYRNMAATEQGSPMRHNWLSLCSKALDAECRFMFKSGVLQGVADKVDVVVKDYRRMSDKELDNEVLKLRKQLTGGIRTEDLKKAAAG